MPSSTRRSTAAIKYFSEVLHYTCSAPASRHRMSSNVTRCQLTWTCSTASEIHLFSSTPSSPSLCRDCLLLRARLFLVSVCKSRCGSPRLAQGSLYSVYWHNLWSPSSTHCMYKSQWVKSIVQHEYFWLPGNKSSLSLGKNTQPYDSHRSRKLFLATVPITWLRAQPSATLITLLMSWEQSSRGSQGLSASQRRPSASWRSELSALSNKSTKQCWSIRFSYCFHWYLRLNHSLWWH